MLCQKLCAVTRAILVRSGLLVETAPIEKGREVTLRA